MKASFLNSGCVCEEGGLRRVVLDNRLDLFMRPGAADVQAQGNDGGCGEEAMVRYVGIKSDCTERSFIAFLVYRRIAEMHMFARATDYIY